MRIVYKRGERYYYYYYFAYPEDHARTELEYSDSGALEPRAQRPIFQVVFVYDPATPTLETYYQGGKETRQDLEQIFGRVILHEELAEIGKDQRVYNLNAFKRRDMNFVYDPSWGIEDVRVKMLRLSLIGGGKRRITLEADPSDGRAAIYDLLDQTFGQGGNGAGARLSLALANVTRVGIEVLFVRTGRRGKRTKTFYLTYPNGCDLRHDGRDVVLREMLVRSGIEPVLPTPAGAKS